MPGYVKLFGSILDSTVWEATPPIKVVWITMLAMADRDGAVEASVPGLAKRAGVERGECEKAIALFLAPDPDSRTKDQEGRRIEVIDGGWRLINYEKYRDRATLDQAREKSAARQQRFRDRKAAGRNAKITPVTDVTHSNDIAVSSSSADPDPAADPPSSPPAGATSKPAGWGLSVWEVLWRNTLRKAPADRHKDGRDRWRDLVERIAVDAALLDPPIAPEVYAEGLMLALPAYAAHAARTGDEVPSVSVAAFVGWYPKLAEWEAAHRPKAPAATATATAAAPRALSPEEAEAEAAGARDAMDRLFQRGKYAATNGAAVDGVEKPATH